MHGANRIPDELGQLIINEDGAVISSSGELENAEQTAATIMSLVSCTNKENIWPGDSGEAFKKISITYSDYSYIICLSNKNIHVVKRKFIPHGPVKV